eukprot:Skav215371  [mRNA]  locus=scaffold1391:833297:847809:- [translate_table: standard]
MDCGSIRGIADEVDCGISAFANAELKPIGGSLKSFPEDFVVEELPLDEVQPAPAADLPFLRFRLKKRGVDTLEAVDALANACRVPAQKFGFAGIKDSFAITTQFITVPASVVTEAALKAASCPTPTVLSWVAGWAEAVTSLPYIQLSHFGRCKDKLVPGQLRGNRFQLRVRGVRGSPEEVAGDSMGSVWGLRKWAEVFRCTNSAEAALRRLPEGSCWAERRLLKALQRRQELEGGTAPRCTYEKASGSGWAEVAKEAFLSLPRTIRGLYAHSYVDRLWNLAATERVTCLGLRLAPGDLIHDSEAEGNFRFLSADEAVQDVCKLLLPRPGSGMQLPANSVGSFMRSYLEYDGLRADDLKLEGPGRAESWQLHGCMRPVLVRPKKLVWHLEAQAERPVAPSDEPAKVTRATNHFSRARAKRELQSGDVKTNLVLDFHLGPGQYATMAMREVMRPRTAQAPRHIVFSSDSEAETRPAKRLRGENRVLSCAFGFEASDGSWEMIEPFGTFLSWAAGVSSSRLPPPVVSDPPHSPRDADGFHGDDFVVPPDSVSGHPGLLIDVDQALTQELLIFRGSLLGLPRTARDTSDKLEVRIATGHLWADLEPGASGGLQNPAALRVLQFMSHERAHFPEPWWCSDDLVLETRMVLEGLWSHKAFRLVPVIYMGQTGEIAVVQEEESKVQIRTKPGLLLEWYEGLLVLDALMRSSQQCPWLESLASRFQKERAQRKLSGSLYVNKKLLRTAVTGPEFVTREARSVVAVACSDPEVVDEHSAM